MRLLLLAVILTACGGAVPSCPLNTGKVALDCKQAVANGLMSKEDCYKQIEESCP